MSAHLSRPRTRMLLARGSRILVAALLACSLVAGCTDTFQPFKENTDAPFSMFGLLDLKADTQWVRVMPVRQNVVMEPGPLDATVTLEEVESGRTVTLRDSLFRFADQRVDSAGYVHDFWTTERLQPGATYRLKAVRSDGDSTTATVVMPDDPVVTLIYGYERDFGMVGVTGIRVRAENVLYADLYYQLKDTILKLREDTVVRMRPRSTGDPGVVNVQVIPPDSLKFPVLKFGLEDVHRIELRLAISRSGWPYPPGLPDAEAQVPGELPTTVEHGVGFVGGVARWTIPLQRCNALEARPGGERTCTTVLDGSSPSIRGRIIRAECSDSLVQPKIRLVERFAGGGTRILEWQSGWDDTYRFVGVEPGADLTLELGTDPPFPPQRVLHLAPLAPGERYVVPDVPLRVGC